MGFLPYPEKPARALDPKELGHGGDLREADLAALRPHAYVEVDGDRFSGLDRQLARRLSQLAVAGVPMLTRALPSTVRSLLGDRLADRVQAFDAGDPPVLRESKSIDLRRAALDLYSPRAVWNTVLGRLGKPLLPLPSVSVVLATRRPERLASALNQLARQSWEAVEVVVVLHGFEADLPEVRRAVEAYPGVLQVRSVPADMIFGDVLNAGVRAASGDLVCKMDDDDWYGPHHLRDLVHAKGLQRRHPGGGTGRIRVPGKPGHHHPQAPARRAVLGPRRGRHHDARQGRAAPAGRMAARPPRR